MKARKHRGGFRESMATIKEIPATLDAVAKYFEVPARQIRVTPYSRDDRQGWESATWLVSGDNGVLGMVNEAFINLHRGIDDPYEDVTDTVKGLIAWIAVAGIVGLIFWTWGK